MAAHPFVIVPSLSAVAIAYKQANLIADQALPRKPVATEVFRFLKHNMGDAFSSPDTRVGRKSAPNQMDWSSSEVTDQVVDQALDTPVPNADIGAYNAAKAVGAGYVSQEDPLSNAVRLLEQSIQNRREYRAAQLVMNPANYAAANQATLSGTSQWSDYANSDPISYLLNAFDTMIMRPNIGVMGRQVATKMRMHPKVCLAVFGNNTNTGVVPMRAIADLLELDEIYVGDAWINTAAPGQAPAIGRCWGKHASFMHRNVEAGPSAGVTYGFTAQYGDKLSGTIEDSDVGMRGGVRVRSGESVKELITANDLAYGVFNAVA